MAHELDAEPMQGLGHLPARMWLVATSGDRDGLLIQIGNVPKHMHPNSNEMQYILKGTGTIWLDDKEVRVKPGDLVIIPKGIAHGGTKPDSGHEEPTLYRVKLNRPRQAQALQCAHARYCLQQQFEQFTRFVAT